MFLSELQISKEYSYVVCPQQNKMACRRTPEDVFADIGLTSHILHLVSLAPVSDFHSQVVPLDLASLLGIIVLCLRPMSPD